MWHTAPRTEATLQTNNSSAESVLDPGSMLFLTCNTAEAHQEDYHAVYLIQGDHSKCATSSVSLCNIALLTIFEKSQSELDVRNLGEHSVIE